MAVPNRKPHKRPLSLVTRVVVVPFLLLAIGIRIGMYIASRAPAPRPVARFTPDPLPLAPTPSADPPAKPPSGSPVCEISATFQDNIYPSLLLSFGKAYPEYAKCLTVELRNLPATGSLQLRIDSGLFLRPLQVAFDAGGGAVTLNPELPWNFDALRRSVQMQPQTFVATLLVDGRSQAEATVVCTVHSVNEAVSRIFNSSTGQWQDTSVCFAAFVNEDHPWINELLQEAMAGGGVRAFNGYQSGKMATLFQVQGIWEALAARGLSYVNMATDSGTSSLVNTQYVRFLDQSVHDQGANCVDASVLFCSILRRIGLRPVLLFRPGHCFAGFFDTAEGNHIVAFETTLLGQVNFSAAVAEGAKELQATLPFLGTPGYAIVDVALCRQQGISPISYAATDRN
ncbi:MAG TPA: hypothetical protein VII43_05275 [Opitutaceae bacterium]